MAYFFTKRYIVGYKFYVTLLVLPMYFTAGMIPTYLVYRGLGLTDNFLVYIVPNLVWAYNILIMRTFFLGLPPSLEESAFIDGATEYTIFFKIILPLSMPVLATIFLFDAVWQWNSWFDTLIYAGNNPNVNTLMSLLAKMIMQMTAADIVGLKASKGAQGNHDRNAARRDDDHHDGPHRARLSVPAEVFRQGHARGGGEGLSLETD